MLVANPYFDWFDFICCTFIIDPIKTTTAETLSRVFVAGDVAGEHAIVKPAGLLSTGLVRSAFPTKWKDRFPLQGKRKTQGAAFERYPAIALWIEDGIGYAGLTEEQAHDEYGTDQVGTTTVQYENCVKACVEPRPDTLFATRMDCVCMGCVVLGHMPQMIFRRYSKIRLYR